MSVHVRWSKGGAARILALSEEAVRLLSTIPSPPGSRISGALEAPGSASFRVKIHSSKRQADGSFLLVGRPLDLTREAREAALGLLSRGPEAGEAEEEEAHRDQDDGARPRG